MQRPRTKEMTNLGIFFLAAMILLSVNACDAFSSTEVNASDDFFLRHRVIVNAVTRMSPMQSAHSRLPKTSSLQRTTAPLDARIQQSSTSTEVLRSGRFFPTWNGIANILKSTRNPPKDILTTQKKTVALSRMDLALFATYFCNMAAVNLSVVTVPAMAAEYFTCKKALAAFIAGGVAMASLGGGVGKIVNGFVCQLLGGRRASWLYLVGLSILSLAMSVSTSLAPVGMILVGYEFLCSIQWTSLCNILDQHYREKPELMARGITILSLSSTAGALAAKTLGAGLLKATNWRTVTRCGALVALLGAAAVYTGVSDIAPQRSSRVVDSTPSTIVAATQQQERANPLSAVKSILGNKLFWQIGIAHSLGYLARASDRLIGPFIHEVSSLPRHICATLTCSVTIGFFFGLAKGRIFCKLESVTEKMRMLKKNYILSFLSILGLAALCGINNHGMMMNIVPIPNVVMAGMIAFLSGIMASTVSFQFYQLPNIVCSTMFPENSSVALSLLDAVGFFVTAQVLAVNTNILSKFGWSASWIFVAMVFSMGGALMLNSIKPVLSKTQENLRRQA